MAQKVIWITGASSGFGYALAEILAQKGHIVYAGARRIEAMEPLKKAGVIPHHLDVTNESSIRKAFDQIQHEQGRIDILYNNAGYGTYGPVDVDDLKDIQAMFEVNLFGAARVNHVVLPQMISQRSGRIILTASLVSHLSTPGIGWYAATKHALNAMVKALRMEVKEFNVDVIQIEPGSVKTGFRDIALESIRSQSYNQNYQPLMLDFEHYIEQTYAHSPNMRSTLKAMERAGFESKPHWVYRTTHDAKLLPVVQKVLGLKLSSKVILRTIRRKYKK